MGAGPLPAVSEAGLYPAEHRALRELYAFARQLAGHWERLGGRLGGERGRGARARRGAARELLGELVGRCSAHGIELYPASQGAGGSAAGVRGVSDLMLERNQALRSAVHDIQHVTTLLGYLAELADHRGDAELAAWHRSWETRLRGIEEEARAAAVAEGASPTRAIEPAGPGSLGRAGHAVANGLGTLGEAIDGSRRAGGAQAARPLASRRSRSRTSWISRRRRHQLPAAGRQREDLAVLPQQHEPALRRRGERRLAQRPVAVVAEVRDRPPDVAVAHAAVEQLADDRRLGDVLDASTRAARRPTARRGCSPSAPTGRSCCRTRRRAHRPRRRGSARGASPSGHGKDMPGPGLRWQARAGVMRCGSVAPAAGTAQPPVTSTYRKLTWPMPIQSPSLSAASLTRSPLT